MYQGQSIVSAVPPNFAVERTAGSHSLAAAAHRERWAAQVGEQDDGIH